jgi:hypothetical protein
MKTGEVIVGFCGVRKSHDGEAPVAKPFYLDIYQ